MTTVGQSIVVFHIQAGFLIQTKVATELGAKPGKLNYISLKMNRAYSIKYIIHDSVMVTRLQ